MSAGDGAAVSVMEGKLAELSTSCDLRTLPKRGKWRGTVGGRSRWLVSEASAAPPAGEPSAELVEVPLAQIGEGIAECELLPYGAMERSNQPPPPALLHPPSAVAHR